MKPLCKVMTLQYDGQRRLVTRMVKTAGVATSDTYVWDDWQLAQEYRSGTANTYAYGSYIDDRIAMKNGSGTYYFHRSYNQSTEAVTDASGDLVERYVATDPYGGFVIQNASGNVLAQSVIGNRSVFQGAPMMEPMSGLVYLRNRWYSPQLGRFVSRDPMGYDAGDVNLYRFVGNGPLMGMDPYGLKWTCQQLTEWKVIEQRTTERILESIYLWSPIMAGDYAELPTPDLLGLGMSLLNEFKGGSCKCVWEKVGVKDLIEATGTFVEEAEFECYEDSCDKTQVKIQHRKKRKINATRQYWRVGNGLLSRELRVTSGSSFPNKGIACGCDPTITP